MTDLIDQYSLGPELLRSTLEKFAADAFDAKPIPGRWSTRQVVCHIADFEIVYADRIKRVVAENQPTLFGGDPDTFADRLAYDRRDIDEEINVIVSIRKQMTRFLRTLQPSDFQRIGLHSEDGPLSVNALLQNITFHLPHHVAFIEQKWAAMETR